MTKRKYSEALDWLAQNTENSEIGDAIRLLAYMADTSEEYVFLAANTQQ